MTSQMIVIKTQEGDRRIPAFVLGRLAVHRTVSLRGHGKGFSITELQTGYAVIHADPICTFTQVKTVAQELLPLFDEFPEMVNEEPPFGEAYDDWIKRAAPCIREARDKLSHIPPID